MSVYRSSTARQFSIATTEGGEGGRCMLRMCYSYLDWVAGCGIRGGVRCGHSMVPGAERGGEDEGG